MSTTKRSHQTLSTAPSQRSVSQPATKRIKSSHVPAESGLEYLADEDARRGKKLEAKLTNGIPRSQASRVNESSAAVAQESDDSSSGSEDEEEQDGKQRLEPETVVISSDEESSVLDEDDEVEGALSYAARNGPLEADNQNLVNGHVSDEMVDDDVVAGAVDAEMEDADEEEEAGQMTFGDLLRIRHPESINLHQTIQDTGPKSRDLVPASSDQIIPAGHTLGTTLSQALKTNDKEMLERCLVISDIESIRGTIERLTSREAAILLENIAERVYRRPGRTGSLLTWVQWTLVCHGGYFAHRQELMKRLRSLTRVLRQRANGLQPLLHLKGKLDLLSAQLEFRQKKQLASVAANMENQDDERGVLYIEGQDEYWSDSDDGSVGPQPNGNLQRTRLRKASENMEDVTNDDELDVDLPNSAAHEEDDDRSVADGEDANEMLDLEAEEESDDAEEESSNGEEESEPEEDESSEDVESEIEVKQPKPSALNRKR